MEEIDAIWNVSLSFEQFFSTRISMTKKVLKITLRVVDVELVRL